MKIKWYISLFFLKILSFLHISYFLKKRKQTIEYKTNIKCSTEYTKEVQFDLSIIIPVYNAEKILEKTLLSILAQKTNYSYEIILIDDGSTDLSADICKKYSKENKNIVYVKQENHGISFSRNKGAALARGEYISFLDNDDFLLPNYIDVMVTKAKLHNAQVVKCDFINYNYILNIPMSLEHFDDFITEDGIGENIVNFKGYVWGGIFERKFWSNFSFPEGFWFEDIIMRMLILRACKTFVYVGSPLYQYNITGQNASKNYWKKRSIKSLDHLILFDFYKNLGQSRKYKFDVGTLKTFIYELGPVLYSRIRKIDFKLKAEAVEYASKIVRDLEGFYMANKRHLSMYEKALYNSLKQKNYLRWIILSNIFMVNSKIKKGE